MEIRYDKKAGAKYVSVKKGKVFETRAISDNVFYDVDASGDVLGIEILDVSENDSKHVSSLTQELSGK